MFCHQLVSRFCFSKQSLHKQSEYWALSFARISSLSSISEHQQPFKDTPQTKSFPQAAHFRSLPPTTIVFSVFSTLLIISCSRSLLLHSLPVLCRLAISQYDVHRPRAPRRPNLER